LRSGLPPQVTTKGITFASYSFSLFWNFFQNPFLLNLIKNLKEPRGEHKKNGVPGKKHPEKFNLCRGIQPNDTIQLGFFGGPFYYSVPVKSPAGNSVFKAKVNQSYPFFSAQKKKRLK
jgi:hypothetical protein